MTAWDESWQEMQRATLAYQTRNGTRGTFPFGQPFYLGGWACPGCCHCYSPAILVCEHCGPKPAVPAEDFTGGAEHDLCVPVSEGGLCDHGSERTCTGGRHCSC